MDIRNSFAIKVKHYRQKQKLTQEELAELTGIAYKYIQKIEGKTTPNVGIDLIEKLAKALKVTPDKLFK